MKQSMPKDGKLLAIGHSMGGILLYSMLSRFGKFYRNVNLGQAEHHLFTYTDTSVFSSAQACIK